MKDYKDDLRDLTVCILTYNHVNNISLAIESVLEQETTYTYEIWLLDDCSTDGTLAICEEYARKYPDLIKLIPQEVNTFLNPDIEFHLDTAIKKIKTKYYCGLEGDDQWCDKGKIQIALDILEDNPEYSIFGHDTLRIDHINNSKSMMTHEKGKNITNPVTLEIAPFVHTSARVYRNTVKFPNNMFFSDLNLFYLYLDNGPLYYYDKVMSIYNKTGDGVWSRFTDPYVRRLVKVFGIRYLNKLLKFKYDDYFTESVGKHTKLVMLKKIFGIKWGWEIYILLKRIKYRRFLKEYKQKLME